MAYEIPHIDFTKSLKRSELRRYNSLPLTKKILERSKKENCTENIYVENHIKVRQPKNKEKTDNHKKLNTTKRQLQLALSCPSFQSYEQLSRTSSPILSSPESPDSPSSSTDTGSMIKNNNRSSPGPLHGNLSREALHLAPEIPPRTYATRFPVKQTVHTEMKPKKSTNIPITAQPATSDDYARFIQQHQPIKNTYSPHYKCKNPIFCSVGCLYQTKRCVSCCTCYWCFSALCYHCVEKDDISQSGVSIDEALSCQGSIQTNLKRAAISATCLPFLPCITLYPLFNKVIDYCIDKKN